MSILLEMTQHEALRKAAILITALDAQTADRLLDHMPEAQAALVRQAVFDLDWIDPQEQQQILEEFLHATSQPAETHAQKSSADDSGVELVLSREERTSNQSIKPDTVPHRVAATFEPHRVPSPARQSHGGRGPRFEFLRDQSGETLARLLEREHPQTIAVVAAHLPPERTADLLQALPGELNIEVLRRVADLDEIDPEMIDEMEHELRRSSTVAAILSAEPKSHATEPAETAGQPADDRNENAELQHRSADVASEIEAYRQLARSVPYAAANDDADDTESESRTPVDWSFADVTDLSDADLASVLQEAGSEITMVALAGSDAAFVARLSNQLSPVMARQFISRMEEIGPLALRDIEAAQERIAEIAARLAEEGIISQKDMQPFAAAA